MNAATFGLITFLSISLTGCQSTSAPIAKIASSPPENYKAFPNCMDMESAMAVKKAVDSGASIWNGAIDPKKIGDQVLAQCISRYPDGASAFQYNRYPFYAETVVQEKINSVRQADLDHQRKQKEDQATRDTPKLKAEFDAALEHYGKCLLNHARAMALASSEIAEVVMKAAFASCRDERKLILDIYRRYKGYDFRDEEVLDIADKKIAETLLLEIIKVRAEVPASPAPRPTPPSVKPDTAI